MRERVHWAVDITGRRFALVEHFDPACSGTPSDTMVLTREGQPLIDEGEGFYRHPLGGCFKLVD